MPWTPLAGGALSGKYLGGATPAEGRLIKYPKFMQRYLNAPSVAATEKYKVGPHFSSTSAFLVTEIH